MPFNCCSTQSCVSSAAWKLLTFALVMSVCIGGFVALILYFVGVRSDHDLSYSMAEPVRQQNSTIYFPFSNNLQVTSIDGKNVSIKFSNATFRCQKGHFSCNSSMVCLALSRRCDGTVDCPNAEDEMNCVCAFRMPTAKFCDKYPDCFDESDESFCNYCPLGSYNCGNGQCISRSKVCNFRVDCQNAMDENFCFKLTPDIAIAPSDTDNRKLPQNSASKTILKSGFLLRNQNGIWYPVCANPYDAMQDSLASLACVSITANPLVSSTHQQRHFKKIQNKEYMYHFSGRFVQWNGCLTDEGIFVTCDDVLCGLNPSLLLPKPSQGRIVGGAVSTAGAWPWHAAIYKNGTYACGATLLNSHWLISASHCFLNFKSNYYEVQLGMLRRKSFTPYQQIYKIERIVSHHRFNVVTLEYDITLLKTTEPVEFDFWVRPICLPDPAKVEVAGTFCTAIGWGDTGEKEDDSDDLQEVHIPLTTSCRKSERWLCAGYPEGGHDACQGDSGGPLMCHRDGFSWYIAGVISAGTGCARPKTPGMYTRVAYFLNWILAVMNSKPRQTPTSEQPLATCPGWKCAAVGGGNCLHPSKVCDGHVDCYDADDEVNCFDGKKKG